MNSDFWPEEAGNNSGGYIAWRAMVGVTFTYGVFVGMDFSAPVTVSVTIEVVARPTSRRQV